MKTRIDISIGPVQGFIAQARRTRDLWGGSFLLSFLAARAMVGAQNAGATVVQPHVEGDALLEWASGKRNGSPPKIGTITNHFAVETNGSPREVANAARNSFNGAWREACAAVWDRYVSHAVSASDLRGRGRRAYHAAGGQGYRVRPSHIAPVQGVLLGTYG